MKSGKNIVFLGMMGSGKTSIGFLVSRKLKLDFFDIDKQIEKKLEMKISNIFNNKGEKFFRSYEEKITLDILKKKNIVIGFGITEKSIKSLKKADGLVVGSALCKEITSSIHKRQNVVTNVTNIVRKLKNKIK